MESNSEELADSLRDMATDSAKIWSRGDFDIAMQSLGYNLMDIFKAFKKGEIKVYELERGSNSCYAFCVAYMFRGYKEACHIRGWVDFSNDSISLTDIFESADMCV